MSDFDEVCEHLAFILSYPEEGIFAHVMRVRDQIAEGMSALQPLVDYLDDSDIKHVEELFTRTFDLNPSCCLEVGWHLYGEDYKRGEFLVNMRQALVEENLPESTELPDHLSHCLRLLPRLEPDDAEAFAQKYLLPALAKIKPAIEAENPYTCVVALLQTLLERRYGPGERDSGTDGNLMELPLLNNVLHYHNTEDLVVNKRTR